MFRELRILTLTVLAALSATSFAAKKDLKPLVFQADKNNVQVLSQRFEYALIDKDQLRIGDILIDSARLRFSLEGDGAAARLHFFWPSGLLTTGRLSLLNNNGKAIWSDAFDTKQLKFTKIASEDDESVRNEIAEFTSGPLEADVIETLKYLPFLNFCVSRESETNRLYLCSQDLFIGSDAGKRVVKPRTGQKKQPRVEINGKEVTEQGIIYLNDSKESLFIRALSESGASIELITKKKDVDFKDVVSAEEGKKIVITAHGAEPARKDQAKKLGDDEWQVTLSTGRPFFFILGDGGIPMRQEFYVRGELPSESMRPFLAADSPDRTYGSTLELEGVHPATVSVKNYEQNASVKRKEKNRFTWTVRDLKPSQVNRRYLYVESGKDKFIAGYDIERGSPYVFDVGADFKVPSGTSSATVGVQWWLEDMLGSRFHWGLGLQANQHVTTSADFPGIDELRLGLLYRFNEGFFFKDPTWGLQAFLDSVRVEGSASMGFGFDLFKLDRFEGKSSWIPEGFEWYEYRLSMLPASSGGDAQLGMNWSLMARGYYAAGTRKYIRFGAGFGAPKTSLDLEKEKPQVALDAGFTLSF